MSTDRAEKARSLSRERKRTEKGLEYQIEMTLKQFRAKISGWRRRANRIEKLLTDTKDITTIRQERDALESDMALVFDAYMQVEQITSGVELNKAVQRYESTEFENHQLVSRISNTIHEHESELRSHLSSRSTVKSSRSRRSGSTQASTFSKKLEAAAEAAALKAKLRYLDVEAGLEAELEAKKVQFEKVRTMREIDIAEAKVDAITKAERGGDVFSDFGDKLLSLPDGKHDYVQSYLDSFAKTDCDAFCTDSTSITSSVNSTGVQQGVDSRVRFINSPLNPAVNDFVPMNNNTGNLQVSDAHTQSTWMYTNAMPSSKPSLTGNMDGIIRNQVSAEVAPTIMQQQLADMSKSFAEQVSLSRLPTPEPGIFNGDPLKYPCWKSAFETLIEQKGIPPSERIHYLKKYLGGSAKEAIEGFFLLTNDDAFIEAKKLLEQRYGDAFVVANAFRDKLNTWPKVASRDGIALRKLADFLRQCEIAMQVVPSLNILNDDQENQKILTKLPEWIVNRWARIVAESREKRKVFPSFATFVQFLVKEANIACDPVTSLQALKGNDRSAESERPSRSRKGDTKRSAGASAFSTEAKESDSSEGKNVTTEAANSQKGKLCIFCDGEHDLDDCKAFLAKTLAERKEYAMKKGLCFKCVKRGHRAKDCKRKKTCKTCSKQHPTSLHGDFKPTSSVDGKERSTETKQEDAPVNTSTGVSHLNGTGGTSKSSMIVPVWVSHCDKPDSERLVYGLLDTQSDTTFILDDTCNALGLEGPEVKLILSTMFAEHQVVESRKISGLMVRGYGSELSIPLPTAYSREIMPANREHIPTPDMARKWPHLEPIANKLMPVADCEVGLLIGYNCSRALAPRDVIPPMGNEPFGQRTDLGWGIVGIVDSDVETDMIGVSHRVVALEQPAQALISYKTRIKEAITPTEVSRMMDIDFNEHANANQEALSLDDRKFLTLMKDGIHRTSDGHYEMPLPFKSKPQLPNNKIMALHRLKHLQKRFTRDERYRQDYISFMEEVISYGYAEEVPESELKLDDGSVFYIPHHGVYHPKKPEKIRVVFDCSAKYKGESLNSHLLQGPDLTNKLVGVISRLRQERIAFICDIEKMFYQFRVNKEHRNFLRFLWWKNGNCDSVPTEYRMKVHLFGAGSSPGCANYGLKQAANDKEDEFGADAADFLRRNFYVDDGLKSVPTVEMAMDLISRSKDLCSAAGLRLHKFASNSKEVLEAIPSEDRAKGLQDLDLRHDVLPMERALGVHWCIESDSFKFRIILKDRPVTRRGVLSTVSSIYDPLGFLAPVILVGKRILQLACKEDTEWDTPLSETLKLSWEQWRKNLFLLEDLKVPRCFKPDEFGAVTSAELHHFADASTTGYGQCSYIRLKDDQNRVHCSFVMGKARVCPLKAITVPRLELTAALTSVKVSTMIHRELEYNITSEVFWTDSKVVLGYIANETRRFHIFVANRVQQIRDNTEPTQWRHVKSEENPADEGSRGLGAKEFMESSKWLIGPEFLWESEVLPPDEDIPSIPQEDPEVKKVKVLSTIVTGSPPSLLQRLNYFSDWYRAKRAVASCCKLKMKLCAGLAKTSQKGAEYQPVNVAQIQKAEIEIIRCLQREVFGEELKVLCSAKKTTRDRKTVRSSPLHKLDPFLDDDGVMRVGGRLRRAEFSDAIKHPVILPKDHHITRLIVKNCHEQVEHQGRGMTINEIRSSGFWIIGCSSLVASCISKCVSCRKWRSQVQEQKMSDLPVDRLEPAPPFTYCGVDFFGPWYIKEGRKELKRYGALFTCMASRAIHVEVANSLSTDSFINALRRFISIRGPIRQLRSDQGTNFVGARNELKAAFEEMDHGHLREVLLKEFNCDCFLFNVPSASHMGGVWERMIRSVRSVLNTLMQQAGLQLDDESLRTLMCEAAAIVNSRPLTTDNLNDPTSLEPLTPNHLLTMKSKIILPPPGEFQKADLYSRRRWRRVQHLLNEFWSRWKREYIQTLQPRQRWNQPRRNLQVGDIVLIKDTNLPRGQWPLARIEETFPDQDNQIRKVKLAISDHQLDSKGRRTRPITYLERPIQKLVLLMENNSDQGIPADEP